MALDGAAARHLTALMYAVFSVDESARLECQSLSGSCTKCDACVDQASSLPFFPDHLERILADAVGAGIKSAALHRVCDCSIGKEKGRSEQSQKGRTGKLHVERL